MVTTAVDTGKRIDIFITENSDLTRSSAVKYIENGSIKVNGICVAKNYRIREGDIVNISIPEPKKAEISAQDIPLNIVYEDKSLIVVNKPKGMVVHPAPGNYDNTLVNALMAHCGDSLSGINGVIRPGIVHRIDKDTSGLLIVAKTNEAHLKLAEQIKEHSFYRVYNAINIGHFKEKEGTVNAPIGRHPVDRKKMAVTEKNSRNAITHYKTISEVSGFSLMEFRLETGRTHQIRVHSAYLGHPVFGDPVYSKTAKEAEKCGIIGQCLHAKTIGFIHPETNEYMEFDSDNPEYFTSFLSSH